VEGPRQLPRPYVVSPQKARRRHESLSGRIAKDDQVLKNFAGIAGLGAKHGLGIAAESFAKVHNSFIAEGEDRFSGAGINGLQRASYLKYEAAILFPSS
jgi:hypothetical protein